MSIHPHLSGIVKACGEYPDTFSSLIHMVSLYTRIYAVIYDESVHFQVELASSGARGDDTAKFRDGILTFMFEKPGSQTAGFIPELQQDPLLPGSEKSHRGWAYIETAYLLCPERYVEEFKRDPEYLLYLSHILVSDALLGCLWNELCLGSSVLTHMTFHIFAIPRIQYMMRPTVRSLMRSMVFLMGFSLSV
jgi:hypothetical protein